MKKVILFLVIVTMLSSCSFFNSIFGGGSGGGASKTGCPANGRAIGAEKLVSDNPAAMKAAKKAPKFKYGN